MPATLVGEVLAAMITPAVLISAAGTLVLSTSNRLGRVVDRVRLLAHDAETIGRDLDSDRGQGERKRTLILEQLRVLSRRAVMLRSAIAALYMAIGFLVATSIGVGVATFFHWLDAWLPIALGMLGVGCLLWGTVLLVREARLAIAATLVELAYVDDVLTQARRRSPR